MGVAALPCDCAVNLTTPGRTRVEVLGAVLTDLEPRYPARIRSPGSYLRCAVLMAIAAIGIHEIRSAERLGEHANGTLAAGAHGYVDLLTLAVTVLGAVAAAHLMVRLVITRHSTATPYAPHRTLRVWWLASIVLISVGFGQELLESLAAPGSSPNVAGMLDQGGWTAIPLAILLAGGVALGVRGADVAIARAGGRRFAPARRRRGTGSRRLPRGHLRLPAPLADRASGRAPPPAALVL